MDERYYTIEHRKGQHITGQERGIIQAHTRAGWTTYKIAKDLGRPYNTVKNEINRGTVFLYNGTVKRYKAKIGASVYRGHRQNSVKKYKWNKLSHLMDYMGEHFKQW